ncbi:unnamed protein product [Orchesella dallaii]|uniref:Telomerase reverse transcriptase n=1 Tax=Orchesella dallaii TaxID=48710 RepID=A0ABP1Q348_9HEXA
MDLSFLKQTLESCLLQPLEIARLFAYFDSIIQTSSQQRILATFSNKWTALFNKYSKNMMIINCTSTWTPSCLSRVDLGKQKPWDIFIRKYVSTFSECTINSEETPEFQPLNFKELVQLTFWKEVYETFGHRIVAHIFDKCALLFEIEEGLYLIVAHFEGVMHRKIRKFQEAGLVPDNRVMLPPLQSKNPYQLSAPLVKSKPMMYPQQEQEVIVIDEDKTNPLQFQNIQESDVCENFPEAEKHTSADINQEIMEPPAKRRRTEKDSVVMEERRMNRWICPKPSELKKLVEHRRNFYNLKLAENATPNEGGLNYILIQKNEEFEPEDKLAVIKQVCPVRVVAPRLPKIWKGLRLHENLKEIAGNKKEVVHTVYTIAETLALKLRFRIKQKKRCRKRKNVVESVSESKSVGNCINDSGKEKLHQLPMEEVNEKDEQVLNDNCDQQVEFDSYIPETALPITSSLYNKSAWTKWPISHGLSKAAAALPENGTTAVTTFIQDIVNSQTCSSRAHEHLVNLLERQLQRDNVPLFKRLVTSVIQTHKKITDMHKLLKNCLSYWRIKYFEKQQKRERKKLTSKDIMDDSNENLKLNQEEMADKQMDISICQLEPEIVDLSSTPSTNFSLSDNLRLEIESPHEHEIMEIDISSQSPQIISSSSNSLNHTYTPLNCTRKTRRTRSVRIRKSNNEPNMYINGLKNEIPYNCVMQTLKQIFKIMKIDSLLGSQRNKRNFFKFVRKAVILGGMKSSLQMGQLMATLHVEDMPITEFCGSDKIAAETFASKVAAWLFNEYVLVILKRSFYITECGASRLQLQFYLKETWISACSKMKKQLILKGALDPRGGGPEAGKANAILRYIPKSNLTLRPLLILNKAEKKLNAADIKIFKVMLHHIDAKVNKSRMFVPSTILKVWRNFLSDWKIMGCPKLFYFRADIRDAYPSVSISKLKEILLDAGGEKGHRMILKQFLVLGAGGRKLVRNSIFDEHCRKNWHSGIHSRPCLVMDLERDRNENAWKVLEHVITVLGQSNVVKLGKKFYEFSHGLPQGWGPSAILCSIYYGYMDSTMYLPFIESSGRLFLRIADDYLFITPSPTEILKLNQLMKFGCEKYKIELNEEKSESNMFVRSNIPVPTRGCDVVTFCGWNFCLTCGHVFRDYKKYNGQDLCSTVAFQLSSNIESPEHFIRLRGTVIVPARLKPIVLDPTINCSNRILLTAFEASVFLSFRFYAICRVVYPSLSAITDPNRAKSIALSIKICCGRLAGYISRNTGILASTSVSQKVNTCTEICCGQQEALKNKGADESHNLMTSTDGSSSLSVNHDSLLLVALLGFRITLRKHHEVFKEVAPQINRTISGLQGKLGSDQVDLILSTIDGGKIPQCFEDIMIKM